MNESKNLFCKTKFKAYQTKMIPFVHVLMLPGNWKKQVNKMIEEIVC